MSARDEHLLRERLDGLLRRARLVTFAGALGTGLALASALWAWAGRGVGIGSALFAILVALLWALRRSPNRPRIALAVERAVPTARNVVVTAEELLRPDRRSPPDAVRAAIFAEASRLAFAAEAGAVVPARTALAVLVGALVALSLVATRLNGGASASGFARGQAGGIISVTVTPPEYLGRAERTVRDPAELVVMRGSRIVVDVAAPSGSAEVRTARGAIATQRAASGRVRASFVADSDGFLAIRNAGETDTQRLIPIAVTADSAPHVAIRAPGRDLLLPNGAQTVAITISATDDIGLRSLSMRFTRVSGSGERFTFTEGEVPLAITRRSAREWEGSARWELAPLKLEPGDMVVYRAIAADARPGTTPIESDALIAEVASPGGVAAAGFALDPEQERYALSQQMVILKTERLLASKARMSADSFASAAAEIAMEQRRVRAEFVFMMGGEMEDAAPAADDASMTDLNEEAEAAGEDELAAGRMVNRGRVALLGSIRNMSRAAAALTAVDVAAALGHEKTALKQLETAFSHSRIILRALADRERLDLTRRLGGALADARSSARAASSARIGDESAAILIVVQQAGGLRLDRAESADAIVVLAERILRGAGSFDVRQRASQHWLAAAAAVRAKRTSDARRELDEGALLLQRTVRSATTASAVAEPGSAAALRGALRAASSQPRGAPRP